MTNVLLFFYFNSLLSQCQYFYVRQVVYAYTNFLITFYIALYAMNIVMFHRGPVTTP